MDMPVEPELENRAEKREFFTVTMEYSFTSLHEGRLDCITGSGLTTNMSDSGLCFYTNNVLEKGQSLTVYCKQISNGPRKAVVRWCSKLSDLLYRVGVSF